MSRTCPLAVVRPPRVPVVLRSVPDLRERWRTSFIEATTYDWAVEHEHVAGVLGRLIWGTDSSAFYRDIARLSGLTAGTRVLDIPCGGGVAFRGLRPEQELVANKLRAAGINYLLTSRIEDVIPWLDSLIAPNGGNKQ